MEVDGTCFNVMVEFRNTIITFCYDHWASMQMFEYKAGMPAAIL